MAEYPSDWDTRRKQVYQRDDYECQNCGRKVGPSNPQSLHAHHIVPKSKGGTHQISNLVSLCEDCHSAIHSNQKAPTFYNQYSSNGSFQSFKKLVSEMQKAMKLFKGDTTIQAPGKLKDEIKEQRRVVTIQRLARFSIAYQPPDPTREKIMDEWIQACVNFLKFPEDGWEEYGSENLERAKLTEYVEDIGQNRVSEVSRTTQQITSEGVASFFEQ